MNHSPKSLSLKLKYLLLVLVYVLAVIIEIIFFLLLEKIKVSVLINNIINISLIVFLILPFIFMIINKVRFSRIVKKYNDSQNAGRTIDEVENLYNEAQANYLAAEQVVIKKKNKIILYKILLSLYFTFIAFLCALALNRDEPIHFLIIVGIVFIFLAPLFWLTLLTPFQYANEYNLQELSKKEYNELYKVVEEAKNTLGCNKPFKLYPVYNSSISVSSSLTHIQICLDCEEVALLTKDELYQVMLHEIAHVIHSDTRRSRRLEHFSYGMEHFGAISLKLFLGAEYIEYILTKMIYQISCSRFYEQKADEMVKKYGDGQTYINGLAKGMLLVLFRESYKPKVDFDIYENEAIPENYFITHLEYFKEYLPVYFKRWDFILRNQILSRQDSHPTFAMRMKFMEIDQYDCTNIESQEGYLLEQHRLLELGSKLLLNTNQQFLNSKEQYFLPTKEKLEEYDEIVRSDKELTSLQKTEYLPYLFDAKREECLRLCDEILTELPKNAYANYYKGFILADLLDKACVKHLYIAVEENMNFAEFALQCIGEFACKVGDEALLKEYRERSKKEMLGLEARHKKTSLQLDEVYRVNQLEDKVYHEILDYMIEIGKEEIKKIYSVSCNNEDGMLTSYLLEWDRASDYSKTNLIYDKIFSYLDRYGDGDIIGYHFELRDIFEKVKSKDKEYRQIVNLIQMTKGSLVYTKEEGKLSRNNA